MLLNRADSLLVLIDVQEKLTPAILNLDLFLARCEWLLKLARKLDVPVLASEQYPKGLGRTVSPLSSYINQEECIEKIHFSCVQEPQYINLLKDIIKASLFLLELRLMYVCFKRP